MADFIFMRTFYKPSLKDAVYKIPLQLDYYISLREEQVYMYFPI